MTVRLRDRVATNLAATAAFYAPAAAVQMRPWLVENGWLTVHLNVTPGPSATEGRCPVCQGGMETCRCGTERPRLPHQSGGAQ
jgi:hypothetical protein